MNKQCLIPPIGFFGLVDLHCWARAFVIGGMLTRLGASLCIFSGFLLWSPWSECFGACQMEGTQ